MADNSNVRQLEHVSSVVTATRPTESGLPLSPPPPSSSLLSSDLIQSVSRSREMEECTSYRRVHEPTGVRKDNDFFSRLPLLEEDYDRLMLQITRDLDFLSERLQVMDYSWLGTSPSLSSPTSL
jgi:hypothetical protein